ncbi:MAG: hypothetical protein ABW043_03280 [Devosia sp.]|uniref:hypothetical protein n=1 Tax=Devosia sp. TaxID=1871048 RepID=UPI003393AAD6
MATKADLRDWVYSAVQGAGGKATIVDVAKHIWLNHESELRASGALFYTWQYDMRWAAQDLRRTGRFASIPASEKRYWELKA